MRLVPTGTGRIFFWTSGLNRLLLAEFCPQPKSAEGWKRYEQDEQSCRQTYVIEIGVGEVDLMTAEHIPGQQGEDREAGGSQKKAKNAGRK